MLVLSERFNVYSLGYIGAVSGQPLIDTISYGDTAPTFISIFSSIYLLP